MEVWLIALLLAAQLAFWGAGLAWLAMPRRWRAFWPLLLWWLEHRGEATTHSD